MASVTITPQKTFTFSQSNNWLKWIRDFKLLRQVSGLQYKSKVSQINTLTMGD